MPAETTEIDAHTPANPTGALPHTTVNDATQETASIVVRLSTTQAHPFPEGINLTLLPSYMVEFFKTWSHLSDDRKSLIYAHQIGESGEWYININGMKMLMQNKMAETEAPGVSIKDVSFLHGKQSYFSFRKEGHTPGRRRPKNEEWEKMAGTVGGWGILRELLQIPLISYIPGITDDDWEEMKELVNTMTCIGTAEAWSGILFASDDAEINTHIGIDALLPVRLMIE